MRRKAIEGIVPTQIRVAVVRLHRDVGSPCPPKPLQRMVGLQASFAQPAPVNAVKWPPTTIFRRSVLASCHGAIVPVLEFGLARFSVNRWYRLRPQGQSAAIVSALRVGQTLVMATALFSVLTLYAAAGVAIGFAFVLFGATRVFPHPVAVTTGARILLLPGAALLWPLVLRRWLKSRSPR
jgi:hypothetical protein